MFMRHPLVKPRTQYPPLRYNPIAGIDSYFASHPFLYPDDTESLFSHVLSRKGGIYDEWPFFGMQGLLLAKFSGPVSAEDIEEHEWLCARHGVPFPRDGWKHVQDKHGGFLPIRVRCVPEGTIVPSGVPMFTVESLDKKVPWVGGWFENKFLRLWAPTTTGARSYACKKVLHAALLRSADTLDALPFMLHDFGSRGTSSEESSQIMGAAHLVHFRGTDTMDALRYVLHYYGMESEDGFPGFSIPAHEHATVTAWGTGTAADIAAFTRAIDKCRPGGIVACVSDTTDFYRAVAHIWCDVLLNKVRDSGKRVVIRPDSGNAVQTNLFALNTFRNRGLMSQNKKGYWVLPPYYRLIQGDGNDSEKDVARVVNGLMDEGFSAENIAFGMGGGLLQKLNRDDGRFKCAASSITRDGVEYDMFKQPKTDPTKNSMGGRLDTIEVEGALHAFKLLPGQIAHPKSVMVTAYENGNIMLDERFDAIVRRANKAFE